MLEKQRYIPEPNELISEIPASAEIRRLKEERDGELKKILSGECGKFLVIVGPCSAHDYSAALEYGCRLGELADKVKDKLFILPRVYTNKPRSMGVGYKGMFLQPDPFKEADIVKGIMQIRKLLIAIAENAGLTAADEMLFPETAAYTQDLISYYAVGARSVENEFHKLAASGMDVPVGMKNPLDGNLSVLLNSIYAAHQPQVFDYRNYQVKSSGNPFAHAVLRGGSDEAGRDVPNYGASSLEKIAELYRERGLENPAVIVDCNHSNSGKRFEKQSEIAMETMRNRKNISELKRIVKGVMIESFLREGQGDGSIYGQSITDPCMGWEETERLIYRLAENV